MALSELAAGAKAAQGGFQVSKSLLEQIGSFRRGSRHAARARELLGIRAGDLFNYRVAMQHPTQVPGTVHPDDAYAFAAIASPAATDAMRRSNFAVGTAIQASLDEGYVLIGSPEAEMLTAMAFGYERKPDGSGMRFTGSTLDLPYRWNEDAESVEGTCTRIVVGQGPVRRPNWPIIDNTGVRARPIYPVVRNDGLVFADLLLITRVPNFLSAAGMQAGRSLVSIAGAHGTGTRAIEVLLRDRKALKHISEEIPNRTQAFQVLVAASKIDHSAAEGSVARAVEVLDVQCFDRPGYVWESSRKVFMRSFERS